MKTRNLTFEPLFGYSPIEPKTPAAYLRLKGYWLRDLGFEPGDRVEVIAEHGQWSSVNGPNQCSRALWQRPLDEITRRQSSDRLSQDSGVGS